MIRRPPRATRTDTLFPYTTLFRSGHSDADVALHALTDAILGGLADGDIGDHFPPSDPQWRGAASRSEEHTSELQSLMRISYAVFCLQKKKQIQTRPKMYSQRIHIKPTNMYQNTKNSHNQ